MNSLFQTLRNAQQTTNELSELSGRTLTVSRCIVTENNDPTKKRRIKVALPSKGGTLQSDWVRRLNDKPNTDSPLPRVGQTVLVLAVDGNAHDLVWLGVQTNDVNPPLDKVNGVDDHKEETPGNHTVQCGRSLRLMNDAGAYIELSELGTVVIGDAFGHTWILGGSSSGSGAWKWDINGDNIDIVNASDFKINGKTIATIGALDSDGDTLQTRGW